MPLFQEPLQLVLPVWAFHGFAGSRCRRRIFGSYPRQVDNSDEEVVLREVEVRCIDKIQSTHPKFPPIIKVTQLVYYGQSSIGLAVLRCEQDVHKFNSCVAPRFIQFYLFNCLHFVRFFEFSLCGSCSLSTFFRFPTFLPFCFSRTVFTCSAFSTFSLVFSASPA